MWIKLASVRSNFSSWLNLNMATQIDINEETLNATVYFGAHEYRLTDDSDVQNIERWLQDKASSPGAKPAPRYGQGF